MTHRPPRLIRMSAQPPQIPVVILTVKANFQNLTGGGLDRRPGLEPGTSAWQPRVLGGGGGSTQSTSSTTSKQTREYRETNQIWRTYFPVLEPPPTYRQYNFHEGWIRASIVPLKRKGWEATGYKR